MLKINVINNKKAGITLEDLKIADFERRVDKGHLRRLKEAIKDNKLVDNIITVMPVNSGGYEVIDGQHRLIAIKELMKENNDFNFEVVLRIVDGQSLDTYFGINKGKPLTASDYTKALDEGYDGALPFFNEFRDYCTHYGSKNSIKYSFLITSYSYAIKPGFCRHCTKEEFLGLITNVSKVDIIRIKTFLYDYKMAFGKDVRSWQYNKPIFGNLLRFYFNHFTEINNFQKQLKKVGKDQYLKHCSQLGNLECLTETYLYLERIFCRGGKE